jgi:predicted acyl esterase
MPVRGSYLALLVIGPLVACTEAPPDFTVRPGVEIATVLDAQPGDALTLYSPEKERLLTIIADDLGQAHFAYVPDEHIVLDSSEHTRFPIVDGRVLRPGDDYYIQNDEVDPVEWSGRFTVLAVDEGIDEALYDDQMLTGIYFSPLTGPEGDTEDGYQYVETRDGTLLSVMVRFPDPTLYGDGPYPTVIEYSGYSPSRPDRPDPGSEVANAFGYATVGVNMRGTGCSGGVFDVFNPAQHADGYDVVEVVARQDWVLHNRVGMVGLSYPGISQLYVASTAPPSLAAVVPLSTIADSWEMQWPGGIYNEGFTRQWVAEREAQAQLGGMSWVTARIEAGDTTCEENVSLSSQSIDFESFLHALEFRPPDADDRDLTQLVELIEAPVFQGGAFQDEQTGAQFGAMLDRFYRSRATKFVLYNGRHPDGYTPDVVFRWYEFLEFYLTERVPELPLAVRLFGAESFAGIFGIEGYTFPADRFDAFGNDYAAALAAYEAEPEVRVLFEVGAGGAQDGDPFPRFEKTYRKWPPRKAEEVRWFLDDGGLLAHAAPAASGADTWTFDAEAGSTTFFGPAGYQLFVPLWDIDWTTFAPGYAASYVTAPFTEDTVIAGPGIAELWVRSPVDDVTVQVTLTEVRPDGEEFYVQSGWLRLGHRAATVTADLRLDRTYHQADFSPVPVDEWVFAEVAIPSVAHPVRAGSSLRMIVSSPGRDHGTWEFESPPYQGTPTFELGRGGAQASSLVMTTLPVIHVPAGLPPCPSLRGQPCRTYTPLENVPAR